MPTTTLRENLLTWFGVDDDWERPRPPIVRSDILVGVGAALLMVLSLELLRSFADFTGARPLWLELVAIVTGSLPLVWRRRFPLWVGLYLGLHFWVMGTWVGEIGYLFVYQVGVFYALYCMLAWARDRRMMLAAVGMLLLGLMVWLAASSAAGTGMDLLTADEDVVDGIFPKTVALITFTFLTNIIFFVAAALTGQVAWRQARGRALTEQQATEIADQSERLAEQAVIEERLRLARELHDVVAHHVSVMGVQAAAARKVLDLRPDQAKQALTQVEAASREAVTQMRGLLGALRATPTATESTDRGPEPTLAELPALIADSTTTGFTIDHGRVGEPGAEAGVPGPIQLSLYRITQEALTNIRRHSTAQRASVTLRLEQVGQPGGYAEIEVLDDGRPRAGTSGTGLGQLGMRERINSLKGVAEIGPRATGGYRVRVRFPCEG